MPTVSVDVKNLMRDLKRDYSTDDFFNLCFDYGIELEEVTTDEEGRNVYKIDIPANRYDMLCPEGIGNALSIYINDTKTPEFKVLPVEQMQEIRVTENTAQIRPYIVGAILKDMTLDDFAYQSLIDLQEKLHGTLARKRTLVAIGTHDLDTLQGPFTYDARSPTDIKFVPLNQTQTMDGNQLMQFYESDRHLGKYLHIIKDSPVFPVVLDSNSTVLSLPPIINGNHSKISKHTKNMLIECTATDLNKANIVLNTIVCMFSGYCAQPFTVEPVKVVYPDGKTMVYPDLSHRTFTVDSNYINRILGLKLSQTEICNLLKKMALEAKFNGDELTVSVPPTRSDILHACDIVEDVGIAYGFNNIPKTTPTNNTLGGPDKINKLSDLVRREAALAGWTEVLPLILCSHDENFAYLNKKDDGSSVKLANPKTVEYQVVRTSLMPGLLKTLSANRSQPLPLRIFEVSDVVFKDDSIERRARNERHFAALYCSKTGAFEILHGLLERVLTMLNAQPGKGDNEFYIQESRDESFFPGRGADVFYSGKKIGTLGLLHPLVLNSFNIPNPVVAVEINIEPFL